jgi:hypothetical protein
LRLTVFALLFSITACSSRPAELTHPLRWAGAWMDSVNSHSWEQVGPLLAPDGTYEDPLSGRPLDPRWAAQLWKGIWRTFPKLHYDLDRVTSNGRVLAVEWTATGVGTARPVRGIFIITVGSDSIASVRGYYNAVQFVFHD